MDSESQVTYLVLISSPVPWHYDEDLALDYCLSRLQLSVFRIAFISPQKPLQPHKLWFFDDQTNVVYINGQVIRVDYILINSLGLNVSSSIQIWLIFSSFAETLVPLISHLLWRIPWLLLHNPAPFQPISA